MPSGFALSFVECYIRVRLLGSIGTEPDGYAKIMAVKFGESKNKFDESLPYALNFVNISILVKS